MAICGNGLNKNCYVDGIRIRFQFSFIDVYATFPGTDRFFEVVHMFR